MRRCFPPLLSKPGGRRSRAFTLLEVVVGVAIFAVGMIAIIGLFAPVARSVGASGEAEIAGRVADALRAHLQTRSFNEVAALMKTSGGSSHALTADDARPDYNPATDARILFANRDGSKIGTYSDAVWFDSTTNRNSDREKFFEIALIRNETISPLTPPAEGEAVPTDPDATAAVLAYTARLRWPAFVPDGGTGAVQVGSNPAGPVRFDHSQKQVMFFSGSVLR